MFALYKRRICEYADAAFIGASGGTLREEVIALNASVQRFGVAKGCLRVDCETLITPSADLDYVQWERAMPVRRLRKVR